MLKLLLVQILTFSGTGHSSINYRKMHRFLHRQLYFFEEYIFDWLKDN